MQPKSRFLVLSLSALLAALLLAGCGGGDTGKSMFNLPSVRVGINESGQPKVAGIPLPMALLAPAQIEALQSADVQAIEARIGYDGILPLLNGENLPGVTWDQESVGVVQELVTGMPGLPNANLIADVLPRLRQFGTGVMIELPGAGDVAEWSGEPPPAPAEAVDGPPTIGPLDISAVTFDEAGNARIGDLALADLGVPVTLPPNILGLLSSLGIDRVTVDTAPDGLRLTMNDRPLPTLAYDEASLQRVIGLAGAFMPGSPLMDTVAEIAPLLPGADLRAAVTFDGVPAGELALDNLSVAINPDGTVRALGLPIPGGPLLPADLLGQMQAAGLENVRVDVVDSAIAIANNGQPFPRIAWTESGEALVTTLAPTLGLPANLLNSVLGLVGSTDIGVTVAMPGASAESAADTAPFAPVDLGDLSAPALRLRLNVDNAGTVTSIGNIDAGDLQAVGLPAITLPANIMDIVKSTGARQVAIQTSDGRAEILLDGKQALSLDYDAASLQRLLDTLKPFLGVELLNDPAISALIEQVILPLAPGANLDISIALP
jgi:hypothetical protein